MKFQKGNRFSVGNHGGRPRAYETPEQMEQVIDQYFQNCASGGYRPLITGLILFLGFGDKKSFYEYGERPEFTHLINRARAAVEMSYEEMLQTGTFGGAIFALKNMGWKDKTETEHSGNMGVTWNETKTYAKDDPKPEADPGN